MASNFFIRPPRQEGPVTVFIRIRSRRYEIDIKLSTLLKTDAAEWTKAHRSAKNFLSFRRSKDGKALFDILDRIAAETESRIRKGFSSEEAAQVIRDIVYEDIRKKRMNAERMTPDEYFERFVSDISSGKRQSKKGTRYRKNSIHLFGYVRKRFLDFEKKIGRRLRFADIDLDFHRAFTEYLLGGGLNVSSIGIITLYLKKMLSDAADEGITECTAFRNAKFAVHAQADTEAVYLTEEEVDRLKAADLSGLPKRYAQIRDIFLIGIYTAQRISDYGSIRRENVRKIKEKDTGGKELTVIELWQQKTGKKVSIPCKSELIELIGKYGPALPRIDKTRFNKCIKEIGKIAGIDSKVTVTSSRGGEISRETVPKYSLISSHTARRTGATLMYLSGMEIYDIMKITGHSSPETLKRYIRADSLEVAEKIARKYDYFK